MAAKTYKCTNFANCDKALTKDLIEIVDGEDFSCPTGESECQKKYLQPAGGGKEAGFPKAVLVAGTVILLAALGYFVWPSGPDQAAAETMITEFFPRLK